MLAHLPMMDVRWFLKVIWRFLMPRIRRLSSKKIQICFFPVPGALAFLDFLCCVILACDSTQCWYLFHNLSEVGSFSYFSCSLCPICSAQRNFPCNPLQVGKKQWFSRFLRTQFDVGVNLLDSETWGHPKTLKPGGEVITFPLSLNPPKPEA